LRAGLVDVSVLVQAADTGEPLLDIPIAVQVYPIARPEQRIEALATTEAATNKLLRAAPLEITQPGRWHVEIMLQRAAEAAPIGFDIEVAEPVPRWLDLGFWLAWPLAPIALFAIRQVQTHRCLHG
jgi:hypothetical protein